MAKIVYNNSRFAQKCAKNLKRGLAYGKEIFKKTYETSRFYDNLRRFGPFCDCRFLDLQG